MKVRSKRSKPWDDAKSRLSSSSSPKWVTRSLTHVVVVVSIQVHFKLRSRLCRAVGSSLQLTPCVVWAITKFFLFILYIFFLTNLWFIGSIYVFTAQEGFWWAAMRTSPNDAFCIVWPLGKFFIYIWGFFILVYRFYICFYMTERVLVGDNDENEPKRHKTRCLGP